MSKPLVQLGGQDTSSWRRLCSGRSDLWGVTPLAYYIYVLAWVCGLLNVFCNCVEFRNGTTSSISIKACPTRGVRSWLFCCSFALPLLWAIQSWEGVLDIFWCKTFIPKWLYAKNGSMKSISIHVSTTFGATSRTWGKWSFQMQEMKSLDKGQFSKKRYAIFFEASAKVHEALTLACKFCVCVCVGGWVSCVSMSCVCSRCLDGFRYQSW